MLRPQLCPVWATARTIFRPFSTTPSTAVSATPAHAPPSDPLAIITVDGKQVEKDNFTNITDQIMRHMTRKLHQQQHHPLCLIKQRIVNHFYKKYIGRTGNPIFSVYDNLNPIVNMFQNFDSLLVPESHVSRRKDESYYLNSQNMLRSHTTAHQSELITSGLDNFLVVGDVYRRDTIDSTHYPVFHQCDAVRLQTQHEVFPEESGLKVFEHKPDKRTDDKQAEHTVDASQMIEYQLKSTLQDLAKVLFGPTVEYRWVEAYFPFTHPSWELEVKHKGEWLELLGCGIMEHAILARAGVSDRIGWAFGLGLERVAMRVYNIPDIRLFWSNDSGFLNQFKVDDPNTEIDFKPVSVYPQCTNDLSFWLPPNRKFSTNDFYDIVRSVGGDLIEQVSLIDQFVHPKKMLTSHCYRIIYRHMERTMKKEEVNKVHAEIERKVTEKLGVTVRNKP